MEFGAIFPANLPHTFYTMTSPWQGKVLITKLRMALTAKTSTATLGGRAVHFVDQHVPLNLAMVLFLALVWLATQDQVHINLAGLSFRGVRRLPCWRRPRPSEALRLSHGLSSSLLLCSPGTGFPCMEPTKPGQFKDPCWVRPWRLHLATQALHSI